MARDERYRRLINSTAWRALRNTMIAARPLCEDCQGRGMLTPATEVHHIIPVETGRDYAEMHRLAYSTANLACLCRSCHRQRHLELRKGSREDNRRRRRAEAEAFAEKIYKKQQEGGGFFKTPPGA